MYVYIFSLRLKEFFKIKNDMFSFLKNLSNIFIIFLFVYGGIVVKMDNSHLFEMVLKFSFTHEKYWIMKIINNIVFFFTCTRVLILLCIL